MPNYITYSSENEEEILHPAIIMWYWQTAVLKPREVKTDFLLVVNGNHRSVAHFIGWMIEAPMVVLCLLGDVDLSVVKSEMKHAVGDPCPDRFEAMLILKMVSGIGSGTPLYLHQESDALRTRHQEQKEILNVKDEQRKRREERDAKKEEDRARRLKEREEKSQSQEPTPKKPKPTKKAPAAKPKPAAAKSPAVKSTQVTARGLANPKPTPAPTLPPAQHAGKSLRPEDLERMRKRTDDDLARIIDET